MQDHRTAEAATIQQGDARETTGLQKCLTVADDINTRVHSLAGRAKKLADRMEGALPEAVEESRDAAAPSGHVGALQLVQDHQHSGLSLLQDAIERLERLV